MRRVTMAAQVPRELACEVIHFYRIIVHGLIGCAAGIPTIIKPFFGDQHFWADRVEALGIGSAVRKLTVQTLSDALVAATTDQKQIQRAARVGEQVRTVG